MRVPSRSLLLLILAVFVVSPGASGQSTSRWIRISDGTIGDPTLVRPSPGSTYVTSVFRDASIYPRSNWWTKVIQSQRQAVLTIAIDGTIRGIHIQDTRVSNPIELRKYDKNISFGFSDVPIIQNVPTTFDAISLTVTLNKTAKDGLQELINTLADISKKTPGLQVSQQALGVLSATKSVADYLFRKNLLVPMINSPSALSSSLGAPGIYAVLAGDKEENYQHYLSTDSGHRGLEWQRAGLTYDGKPVQGVSYFVIEVGYRSHVFDDPKDALSLSKPWASLYALSRRDISGISDREDAQKKLGDIRSHMLDAKTLLDDDHDYIQAEKDSIDKAVHKISQEEFSARLNALGVGPDEGTQKQGPTVTNQHALPGHKPPLILFDDDKKDKKLPPILPQVKPIVKPPFT